MTDRETTKTQGIGPEAGSVIPAKVVVVDGPDAGLERALGLSLEIGSDAACDLVLTDTAVSRRHLRLRRAGDRIAVRDLGSRNGSFVDGVRIVEAELPLGAVVKLGHTTLAVQPRWHVRELAPYVGRTFGELVGESVAMREVFAVLERAAAAEVPVLLEGESGTGKELAARSVHAASPRAGAPYVVFDCTSVASGVAESELFGHKKGAFTGAVADRTGAFQQAHGGTICLDELGDLPLELQAKLLRVLETGEVRGVGDDRVRRVDVRFIAATNRDLHAEVRRGRFRADLLYRLDVVRVRLPPLRSRPEDIAPILERLVRHKLAPGSAIGGENLRKLASYAWPGNVRELRNVVSRALALAATPEPPTFDALVFNLGPAASAPATIGVDYPGVVGRVPYKQAKAQLLLGFDRAYVAALLERHRGNVSAAALEAKLSRKHFYELMRRADATSEE